MFFGKPHIENPVIYHSSRMAQRELRLMGKVVQPLQSVSNYYNSSSHSYGYGLRWFLVNIQVCVTTILLVLCETLPFVDT
jgi:hypothetical protein